MDRDRVERQLELAWQAFTPSRGLRGHVRERLAETGVVPLPSPHGLAGGAVMSGWRALRASGKQGLGLGAALLAAGFMLGRVTTTSHWAEPAPRPIAPASDAVSQAPSLLDHAALPLPAPLSEPAPLASEVSAASKHGSRSEETRPMVRRTSAQASVAPKAGEPRDWRGELELLERAERGVRADNAALALALLREHEARYPKSVLLEERRAIELMAHCRVRATDGKARATRFLADYPSSVYADRVTDLCKLDDASSIDTSAEGSPRGGHQ